MASSWIWNPWNCRILAKGQAMNKFQAMARIMMLIAEERPLKPGSQEFKLLRKIVSYKIDRLGPDGAIAQIKDTKAHLLAQIESFTDTLDSEWESHLNHYL
jgi:hypothetical protein